MMKWLIAAAVMFIAGQAMAQSVTVGSSAYQRLYYTGTSVGNGADTTEDVLQTFTLAAGQLANVGDMIHIVASGKWAGSTDTKTLRLRAGGVSGTILTAPIAASANVTQWSLEAWITKSGSNTQTYAVTALSVSGSFNGVNSGTLSLTDTGTIQLVITGQDSTSATANAITCQTMFVDYQH